MTVATDDVESGKTDRGGAGPSRHDIDRNPRPALEALAERYRRDWP